MHLFIYKHIYFSEVTVIISKQGKKHIIKTLRKLGMEGNFLHLIKSIYKKVCSLYCTKWRDTEFFPPQIRNKFKMPTLSTSSQQCIWDLSQYNEKEKKRLK